jgi:RHS repeat-associated protein
VATALTYAPMSNLLTAMTHGNGLITTAGYDLDYRLSSLNVKDGATNVSALAYAYTDGMNLTGITDGVTAANSNTLGYSLANRLNAATGPWGSKSFGYDGVGNRITDNTTLSGTTTNRTQYYGTNDNRLGSIYENTTTQIRSNTYDNAGNIITDVRPGESFAYTYNKRNRLTGVTRNTASYATYGYNALEQLTTRTTTAGGPVRQVAYTYDLDGHLITEAVGTSGVKTREYIWLPSNDNSPVDLPLAVIDIVGTTATISTVHADHLGRPIRMTNAAKATVWQATWKPWGEVQTLSGTNSNNLRFPGQYFQIETGLHYNHHRMYDPVTGRYTQPDPLRFVDGPSIYAYAKNSPYMRVDRDGLASCSYSISSHTLTCTSNDGNTTTQVGPNGLNSGVPGSCRNNASCSGNSNEGPIPPGNYNMNKDNRPDHEGYWRLEPNPPTSGILCRLGLARCGFELHPGSRSLGCITADITNPSVSNDYLTNNHLLESENGSNRLVVAP